MKANELRIGNLVTDEFYKTSNTIITVEDLNEKGINLSIEDDGRYAEIAETWIEPYYEYEKLFGIPLTEEWLLKFGFEKTTSRIQIFLPNIQDKNAMYLSFYFSLGIVSLCDMRERIETINLTTIKHVHQLQNLYFALTGEELTIKN